MRTSTSVWALSLALLQGVDALNMAVSRQYQQLAEMGLLPDGTPINVPSSQSDSPLRLAAINYPVQPAAAAETINEEYVELNLDQFTKKGNQAGTFHNRFWVAQSAYKPGGPVFLYDVGEANGESNALFRLQNETSFFKQFVDQYNGIGIVWEHRYYGNSTPVPIDLDTPPEAFKYLTTEQSLADVVQFANQFSRKDIKYDLTPKKTPWIFVGGSYPAMRAAFIRNMYPDTIYASYASSAPVEAKVDMSVYFEPVWRGLNHYGFGNCSQDIHAAIQYMDNILAKPKEAAKLKQQFLGLGAEKNTAATFADALTVIFATWQSYGVDGGSAGLRRFCDFIETDPATNKTAPAQGWAATKGAKFAVDRWAAWAPFVPSVNNYLTTNCSGSLTTQGDCNLDLQFTDPASISWTWQYCTQWGYFQSANLGDHQIVSKWNSLEHQKDVCHRQFPTAKPSLFPEWPRTDLTNKVLGGWDIRPSNTYWSGGEFDPWRTLSPLSAESWAPHPQTFTSPPKCGEEQTEDEIFGYVMGDAEHCFDFRTYFPGGAPSRQYFTTALDKWLKCFKPKKGGY